MIDCFAALGGNIGDTFTVMSETVHAIARIPGISSIQTSRLFATSPVSDIPQNDYLNAVCRFQTSIPPLELLEILEEIERKMGKTIKAKNAPRIIDIDILFYGEQKCQNERITLPHPEWHRRLFVLTPLADLIEEKFFINIPRLREQLSLTSKEQVKLFPRALPFYNK